MYELKLHHCLLEFSIYVDADVIHIILITKKGEGKGTCMIVNLLYFN